MIGYELAVSRMVLRKTGRGPVWFFGRLRLGSLDINNCRSQYESSSVVQRSSSVVSVNIKDKIQGCCSADLYTVLGGCVELIE
jgi:hypothetical protein